MRQSGRLLRAKVASLSIRRVWQNHAQMNGRVFTEVSTFPVVSCQVQIVGFLGGAVGKRRRKSKNRMPPELREAVYERAQYFCEVMEKSVCTGRAGHVHHRRMRSQGGGHTMSNCVATCPDCHTYIHYHPAISYTNGWLVKSTRDPEREPFLRRGGAVFLFEDGEMEGYYDG